MAMDREDEFLAREIGKVGAFSGAGMGGYWGANLVARFLPKERFQLELELQADPHTVLEKAYAFLSSNGGITDSDELQDSHYPTISGVIGSGFWNMNPAILHVEFVAVDGETCRVLLTGAAKEGLIKQRTAEKAVMRLAEALKGSS
jgi:hypothetical protein